MIFDLAGIGACSGNCDLDGGLTGADDRRLADRFSVLGVLRLQFAGGADREALDVDRAVLVGFEIDLFQRRRVGPVLGADFARGGERDRRQLVLRERLRGEAAVEGEFEVAGFDFDRLARRVAMPATPAAIRAPRAIVNIRYLRISLYLSFAACPSRAVAVESLRELSLQRLKLPPSAFR